MPTQDGGARPGARTFTMLMSGCFLLLGVINLLNRDWLAGALFLSSGLVVLKGREIDRWPKAARYLITLAVGALAVAVFVRLVMKLTAGG